MSGDDTVTGSALRRYKEAKFTSGMAGFFTASIVGTVAGIATGGVGPFVGSAFLLAQGGALAGMGITAQKTYNLASDALSEVHEKHPQKVKGLPEKPSKLALLGNFVTGMLAVPTLAGAASTGLGLGLMAGAGKVFATGAGLGAVTKALTWLVNRETDQALAIRDTIVSGASSKPKTKNSTKPVKREHSPSPGVSQRNGPSTNPVSVSPEMLAKIQQKAVEQAELAVKNKWNTVKVHGADVMKSAAWLELMSRGIEVTGYTPTDNDRALLRDRLISLNEEKALSFCMTPTENSGASRAESNSDQSKDVRIEESIEELDLKSAIEEFDPLRNTISSTLKFK